MGMNLGGELYFSLKNDSELQNSCKRRRMQEDELQFNNKNIIQVKISILSGISWVVE